jgi:acetylornithine deacetylase
VKASIWGPVDEYIRKNEAELVDLVCTLVRFDTTSVDLSPNSNHPTNDEAQLQAYVGRRLNALGAEVDQWEPEAQRFADHPMMPSWHHWENRPLTVGVLRGNGEGKSLIINGHIDVVSAGNEELWTSPPLAADLRDGRK